MAKIQITENDIMEMVYNTVQRILKEDSVEDRNDGHMSKDDLNDQNDSLHSWLNDDTTDKAAVARQLWPDEPEDSRRSKFYKYTDHASYEANGKTKHYDFSPEEEAKLNAIKRQ